MFSGLRCGRGIIIILIAIFLTTGCAVKKKLVEPAGAKTAGVVAGEAAGKAGMSAGVEAREGAALAPGEEHRIEEEELAMREGETDKEAIRALERFTPQDIYFAFDRSDLDESAIDILASIAGWMEKMPSIKLRIEGHADERGTSEYNLALGEKRSNSVRKYIISSGINGDRLSFISYGEEMPADHGHGESAWAKNRRVHFEVVTR